MCSLSSYRHRRRLQGRWNDGRYSTSFLIVILTCASLSPPDGASTSIAPIIAACSSSVSIPNVKSSLNVAQDVVPVNYVAFLLEPLQFFYVPSGAPMSGIWTSTTYPMYTLGVDIVCQDCTKTIKSISAKYIMKLPTHKWLQMPFFQTGKSNGLDLTMLCSQRLGQSGVFVTNLHGTSLIDKYWEEKDEFQVYQELKLFAKRSAEHAIFYNAWQAESSWLHLPCWLPPRNRAHQAHSLLRAAGNGLCWKTTQSFLLLCCDC